jgi:hypothetical protein
MRPEASDSSKIYPPGYFQLREQGAPWKMLRFKSSEAHIHRFAHRYRLAKEFQSANFATYAQSTAGAYSALCKYLFTFGAFEGLQRVLGIEDTNLREFNLSDYPTGNWDIALRAPTTHAKLFACVSWPSRKAVKAHCMAFIAGKPYHFLLLASAVRNSFAHGDLAANSNKTDPEDTRRICDVLSDAIFTIMDKEFGSRALPLLERHQLAITSAPF